MQNAAVPKQNGGVALLKVYNDLLLPSSAEQKHNLAFPYVAKQSSGMF